MSDLKNINEQLAILKTLKQEGKLTADGEKALNTIESGPLTTGIVQDFLQGATFNTSDEIGAWMRSQGLFGSDTKTDYDTALSVERSGLEANKEVSPVQSTLSNMVGSAIPTALMKRPGGFKGNVGQGGLIGGLFGYGGSESETKEGQAVDTATGMATGAITQPIASAVLNPIGNIVSSASSYLRGPKALGTQQARALLKEAIENDSGGEEFKNMEEAFLYVLNKNTTGKPYTIADLGPNSQALLDVVNLLPGQSKQVASNFLKQRDKGILTRLSGDLQDAFGSKANYFEEYKALEIARKELGDKLYNRAYRKNVKVNSDLLGLLKRPSMKLAFDNAFKIANEEGQNIGKYKLTQNGLTLNGRKATNISTKFMHYMKRGLDDVVYNSKSPISGTGKDLLNASKGTRIAFLDVLDEQNPAYKLARNYWSGKASVFDAMKEGRGFLTTDSNELADIISDMSKSELEGFRLGSMQGILSEIEKGSERTAMSRLLKSPERQKLLKLTFPQTDAGKASANKFINNLESEVVMRETSKNVIGGSQTAIRTEMLRKIRDASNKSPVVGLTDLVTRSISKDFKTIADKQETAVAFEIAKVLTETNPQQLKIIEKELSKKGIKEVLKRFAPGLLSNLTKMLISPANIAAQSSNLTSQIGIQNPYQ